MNFFRNIFASSLIPCCALFSPLAALSEWSIQRVNPVDTSDLVLDSYPSPSSLKPISREELQNLEMSTAVRLAEERNPIIKENYQDFVASSNQLGAAYATWWPTITGDLNFGWYGQNAFYNYAGATSGIDTSIYGNSSELPAYLFDRSFTSSYLQGLSTIDLDWKIYDPSRQPLIDKNQSLLDQASSDYTISRRDYGLKTREAFVKLQTSLAGISTSSQLVENDRFLLRLAKSRKRLGVASDLDIAKQLTVLKTDEVNQVTAQRDARVA